MRKMLTYFLYLSDYLKHGDLTSVISSVKFLLNRTSSHSKDRIIRTSVGRFYCRKNTNDFQFANFYYEWAVKKFILKNRNEYTYFVDAGSCIGDYCIFLSKYNLKCIAFEPVPDNHASLLKNLELNNLSGKVATFPFGLGNENKQVRFKFRLVNTGASHIDRENNSTNPLIEIRTFNSMLAELAIDKNEKILFKLDVEDMEIDALKGASDFITQYPNITFIIEDSQTGIERIKAALNGMAEFECGIIDEYNLYARKVKNIN